MTLSKVADHSWKLVYRTGGSMALHTHDSRRMSTLSPGVDHIDCLDGLRGIAALWVFLSHAQILSGMRGLPVLSWGGLAVDLFMMLSGFLMAHHYRLRRAREPWSRPSTWAVFWLRRWFRIAPLYYLLLAVALAIGPWVGEYRDAIAAVWPATATQASRYTDQSLANLLLHLSFVFGTLPDYAFRTPLPDWSIGLEMQFYLAFPFLMLLFGKAGPLRAGLAVIAACLALRVAFPEFIHAFEMPAFLPIKLYVFTIGIWIALSRGSGARGGMLLPLLVSVVACAAILARDHASESAGRLALVVVFFYLMDDGSLPASAALRRLLAALRQLLATPLSRFSGDTSYGLYLVHLLVLIPVAGWLAQHPAYVQLPAAARFLACAVTAGTVSYAVAWLLFHAIEKNGIRAGKQVLETLRQRRIMGTA